MRNTVTVMPPLILTDSPTRRIRNSTCASLATRPSKSATSTQSLDAKES
jgi:hypothetical protein